MQRSPFKVLYAKEGRGRAIGAAVDFVDVRSDTMGMMAGRVAVDGNVAPENRTLRLVPFHVPSRNTSLVGQASAATASSL